MVKGRIGTAVSTRPDYTRRATVTVGARPCASGGDAGRRRAATLVVFPASGTVFVVRVFLHMNHAQSFGLLHVRASVLRRQTSPFFT